MESLDLQVLDSARAWRQAGHAVTLVTVIETWGSAPRPPGALLALRDDGQVAGSVSGGCVEDDMIARVQAGERPARPTLLAYGVTKEEAARFGLPCGGTLRLLQEPLLDTGWIDELLARTAAHRLVAREVDLDSFTITLRDAHRGDQLQFDGNRLVTLYGPRWRLLVIGAGQLSRIFAQMAQALDYEVLVCDPREEYGIADLPEGVRYLPGMPDDAVVALQPDAHTAIVALTHDPKLDDMALIEALKSPAFYVGALGSRANTARRQERLALFDLAQEEIGRLHGPIGLHIGSRTPAEIAISILAEITAVKNGVTLTQKKAGSSVAPQTGANLCPAQATAVH
jgi:xanthine dehydrogenase accessory factor